MAIEQGANSANSPDIFIIAAQQKRVDDGHHYRPLLQAALEGDWAAASKFFERDSPSKLATITSESRTVLHMAAMSAQDQFVEKLVELLSPEALQVADGKKCTALHYAALGGRIRMVKALVGKNPKLTNIVDGQGFVPLRRSAEYGAVSKEVLWFLAINTKDDSPRGRFPDTQAFATIYYLAFAGHFDVSLYLLRQDPHLAKERTGSEADGSLLRAVSLMPSHFLSGARLSLWERLLYKCQHFYRFST
ncbi:hypothetical protein BT93_C1995 [Corymbia citriodora subsp. variegata]|nr:hypothetical protein BT93_C1995 [Corymbia citriodora subsp. variegata]